MDSYVRPTREETGLFHDGPGTAPEGAEVDPSRLALEKGEFVKTVAGNPFDADFERTCPLGKGAFGEVYLARSTTDGLKVAIKELRPKNE